MLKDWKARCFQVDAGLEIGVKVLDGLSGTILFSPEDEKNGVEENHPVSVVNLCAQDIQVNASRLRQKAD